MPEKILVVCGPTATGKTALSVVLATEFGGEVVNADSTQVYRGMDVGTAKPTAAERGGVPHHLFDVRDPDAPLTAADWAKLAEEAIAGIRARGRLPVVVGGTGLYLRALVDGLFEAPPVDAVVRRRIDEEIDAQGPEALHARLAEVDPVTAAAVAPRDRFRISRALEVYESSGTPISAFRAAHAAAKEPPRHDALWIGLTLPRAELYARIDARQRAQVEAGLLDEWRRLAARFGAENRLLNGLCYRHMRMVAEGRATMEEAIALDQRDNRRYAKRQLTWFRKVPGIRWFDARSDGDAIRAAVQGFL